MGSYNIQHVARCQQHVSQVPRAVAHTGASFLLSAEQCSVVWKHHVLFMGAAGFTLGCGHGPPTWPFLSFRPTGRWTVPIKECPEGACGSWAGRECLTISVKALDV